MTTLNTLHDLYLDQLQDLYSAETQLIRALPDMAQAATAPELRVDFELHLEQTRQQLRRLQTILSDLGEVPGGHPCEAMQGLIAEGQQMIRHEAAPAVRDAGLIACAQRVEHYEIAAYGSALRYAEVLGNTRHVERLRDTENEEKRTDQRLTQLAEALSVVAAQA